MKTPFGYYIYEVKATHPSSQQSLAQVKETIKSQLASTQQQTAFTEFVKEFRKRWEGRTECRTGYTVQDCKGYKAPKAAAGAAGARRSGQPRPAQPDSRPYTSSWICDRVALLCSSLFVLSRRWAPFSLPL